MKTKNIITLVVFVIVIFGIWKFREGIVAEQVRAHGGVELPDISDKRTEVQRLEARVNKLEQRLEELREQQDKDFDSYKKHLANTSALLETTLPALNAATNLHGMLLHLMALTNSAIPAVQKVSRAVNPGATKNGLPLGVYNMIAANAAKEWPGNFTMQDYEIRRQTEAWQKLNR